jgi:hypothetical protein
LFIVLALLAGVVWLCFQFFFPWVSPKLPFNQDTIEGDITPETSQPATPSATSEEPSGEASEAPSSPALPESTGAVTP